MQSKSVAVLDVLEEKGHTTVEQIIGDLPARQQKKAAQNLITELHSQLTTILVKQKLTESRMKKLVAKINATEPMKAVKQMKKEVRKSKADSEKLALMLLGAKKMAKQMGIELPDIKALED